MTPVSPVCDAVQAIFGMTQPAPAASGALFEALFAELAEAVEPDAPVAPVEVKHEPPASDSDGSLDTRDDSTDAQPQGRPAMDLPAVLPALPDKRAEQLVAQPAPAAAAKTDEIARFVLSTTPATRAGLPLSTGLPLNSLGDPVGAGPSQFDPTAPQDEASSDGVTDAPDNVARAQTSSAPPPRFASQGEDGPVERPPQPPQKERSTAVLQPADEPAAKPATTSVSPAAQPTLPHLLPATKPPAVAPDMAQAAAAQNLPAAIGQSDGSSRESSPNFAPQEARAPTAQDSDTATSLGRLLSPPHEGLALPPRHPPATYRSTIPYGLVSRAPLPTPLEAASSPADEAAHPVPEQTAQPTPLADQSPAAVALPPRNDGAALLAALGPANETAASAPADSAGFSRQIFRQVTDALSSWTGKPKEIILTPIELGQLSIATRTVDKRPRLEIRVSRESTLVLMQKNLDLLARELGAMGHADMTVVLHGPSEQAGFNLPSFSAGQGGRSDGRDRDETASRDDTDSPDSNVAHPSAPTVTPVRLAGTTQINIRM